MDSARQTVAQDNRPEEDSLLLALAWTLHDDGKWEEAAECFERLFARELARRLFTGFAYDELVRIYRERKQWERLVSVCERAAAAQPDDANLLRTLGEACLAAGNRERAQRVFERWAALEADSPDAWCGLGDARLAAGDAGGAEAAYGRAAEISPADAPVLFRRLANAFLFAGRPERARDAFGRCLAERPDEPLCWMGFGEALVCMGNPEAAAEAFARAASCNPANAGGVYSRLGNLLTRRGLHGPASDAFRKAVAAEPDNPRVLLLLASSFTARGLNDSAAAALQQVEALLGIRSAKPG
jgi:tetratricopeptide (TPR) repeat protein